MNSTLKHVSLTKTTQSQFFYSKTTADDDKDGQMQKFAKSTGASGSHIVTSPRSTVTITGL